MYLELPKNATTDIAYNAIATRRAVATYQLKVIVPWPVSWIFVAQFVVSLSCSDMYSSEAILHML